MKAFLGHHVHLAAQQVFDFLAELHESEAPVPALIAFISGVMTLEEGDLISTGTPSGVGNLEPGDVVEIEIEGIGVLRNPGRGES